MYTSSIAFQSFQNSLSSAYAERPEPVTRTAPLPPVIPIRPDPSPTALASQFSTLLNQLGWEDVPAAQATILDFQSSLTQSTSSNALPALLQRIAGTLTSGTSQQALAQVQTFLLDAGQTTGSSFSARV